MLRDELTRCLDAFVITDESPCVVCKERLRRDLCFLTVCEIELDTVRNLTSKQTCAFFQLPGPSCFGVFLFAQLEWPSNSQSWSSASDSLPAPASLPPETAVPSHAPRPRLTTDTDFREDWTYFQRCS